MFELNAIKLCYELVYIRSERVFVFMLLESVIWFQKTLKISSNKSKKDLTNRKLWIEAKVGVYCAAISIVKPFRMGQKSDLDFHLTTSKNSLVMKSVRILLHFKVLFN